MKESEVIGKRVKLPANEDNPVEFGKIIGYQRKSGTFMIELDRRYWQRGDDGLREVIRKDFQFDEGKNFTKLEMSVLKKLFESSAGNDHDFGFIEDARKSVANKTQLSGVVASLIKKNLIVVHDAVKNDSGRWTQFTFKNVDEINGIINPTTNNQQKGSVIVSKANNKKSNKNQKSSKKTQRENVDVKLAEMPAESQKITILVKENPKRDGSEGFKRFALYKNGMSVGKFLAKGGTRLDVRWDIAHKYISVK